MKHSLSYRTCRTLAPVYVGLLLSFSSQAQSGANNFPSIGNASVGTTAATNNFTVNGTITTNGTISQTGGATSTTSGYSTYMLTNSTNNSQSTNLMPGILAYGDRWFDYGLDVGYNSSSTQPWRTRIFCPFTADVALSYISEIGTPVTTQSQLIDGLIMLGGSGNVLIGKSAQTNSTYKLDVGGPIRGNEVVVNTTGADFVFDPAYNLLPLPKLSAYIQTNRHLPGIAPAVDMQKNGLSLGENQTKLLQKVEELTLYVIGQNDELRRKDQQLQEQAAMLKAFDERLRKLEETHRE